MGEGQLVEPLAKVDGVSAGKEAMEKDPRWAVLGVFFDEPRILLLGP